VVAKEPVLLQRDGAGHIGLRRDRFIVDHDILR
jgi:hypothetical protein